MSGLKLIPFGQRKADCIAAMTHLAWLGVKIQGTAFRIFYKRRTVRKDSLVFYVHYHLRRRTVNEAIAPVIVKGGTFCGTSFLLFHISLYMFCKAHKCVIPIFDFFIYLVEKAARYLIILKAFLYAQVTTFVVICRVKRTLYVLAAAKAHYLLISS